MANLVVERVKSSGEGQTETFVLWLVDMTAGSIPESSKELTEIELRQVLAENYGESETEIDMRLRSAREHVE